MSKKRNNDDASPTSEGAEGTPPDTLHDEAPAPEPAAPEAPPAKAEPRVTVANFVRGKGPIGAAFLSVESLNHKQARMQTRAQWEAEYNIFLAQPRG